MNIGKLFGIRDPFSERSPNAEVDNGYTLDPTCPFPECLVGIELEAENIQDRVHNPPLWMQHTDGSLRNNGREFVTLPVKAGYARSIFKRMLDAIPDADFSARAGIHIHLNVTDMDHEQLSTLLFTYIIFEDAFYQLAGNDRDKSVFCVPLRESNIALHIGPKIVKSNWKSLSWLKYTGLNLRPVRELGTVEFRHLRATNDIEFVVSWINLIVAMKKYAMDTEPAVFLDIVKTLNTTSAFDSFAMQVFKEQYNFLRIHTKNFQQGMEKGVTIAKSFGLALEYQLPTSWKGSKMQEILNKLTISPELFHRHLISIRRRIDRGMWPLSISVANLVQTFQDENNTSNWHENDKIGKHFDITPEVVDVKEKFDEVYNECIEYIKNSGIKFVDENTPVAKFKTKNLELMAWEATPPDNFPNPFRNAPTFGDTPTEEEIFAAAERARAMEAVRVEMRTWAALNATQANVTDAIIRTGPRPRRR